MENDECDRLHGEEPDFLDFLAAAPDLSMLEIERSNAPARPVDPLDD
jgi:hypothetical protein